MNSLLLILGNRRYFAPIWIFASLNIVVSTWVLYVPTVKERLGLTDGELGLALFAFSIGMLTVIPVSSFLLRKLGLGRLTFVGIIGFAACMMLPVQASSYNFLVASLFCCGVFTSLTDIGMNALVSEIEMKDDVHIMSAAHGFFSLGGVIGAGIGSLILGLFAAPVYHSLAVAIFVLITNGILVNSYYHSQSRKADRGEDGKFKFSLIKPLLGLTILAILIMGSEGAIEHWSKLYLLEIVGQVTDQVAGLGFVIFSAAMTTGRFLGDGISKQIGSFKIIIGGSLLAAAGFGLVLLASFWPAMIGFGLVGLGFSVIIPELFRLAGKAKGVSSAEGISVVAGLGYVGFLASPALLGMLSDWGTLRLSFTFLLGAAIVAAVIGTILKLRETQSK